MGTSVVLTFQASARVPLAAFFVRNCRIGGIAAIAVSSYDRIMRTRRIGIVGYDDVQALDVTGPADTFAAAARTADGKTPAYEVVLLGLRKGRIRSQSGIDFYAGATLSNAGQLDTIVIPGGKGLRTNSAVRTGIAKWLQTAAPRTRRVASVCTGIYALAEAGLLDGRSATTHWHYAADVRDKWKKIGIDADAIYIKDGKYYTSAGITAGIDLCLALVEEDCGQDVALEVARGLVVYLKRSGGQLQYSQPLLLQTQAKEHFGDVAGWIRGHLADDLTVESIAERVNLSPRHFARKFKDLLGVTPADFVEELRLDEARWMLVNARDSIAKVARSVGYASDDTFRRAFERRFGVAPAEYRSRFG
jgi:transcriptional regulator GlxA family with amidase domain